MKHHDATDDSVQRTIELRKVEDAAPSILRRAAAAALLQDSRLEIRYDESRGEYQLGVSAGC